MAPDVLRRLLLAALGAACLAVLPFLRNDVGADATVVSALLLTIAACQLAAGALLAVQYLARGASTHLLLAAAFAFGGLLSLLHTLVLPGALSPGGILDAGPHGPAWTWAIGHAGLPVALVLALWGGPQDVRRVLTAPTARRRLLALGALGGVAALVGLVAWTVAALGSHLPAVTDGERLSDLGVTAGPIVITFDVLALIVVLRRGRRSALEQRLFFVVACQTAGAALAVTAAHRFSVGWYAAAVLDLVAIAIVLASAIADSANLGALGAADARARGTDELTGVATHAAVLVAAEHLHAARAEGAPLAIALVDVDGLPRIAREHGQLASEAVLLTVATRLRTELRDEDVLGRAGHDGFVIVLPGTDADGATLAIDRAVAAVRAEPLGTWAHDVRTTASGGIAMVGTGDDAVAEALAAAGVALQQAKAYGRDQVVSPARARVVPLRRAGVEPQAG